jgi:hypothetical protein
METLSQVSQCSVGRFHRRISFCFSDSITTFVSGPQYPPCSSVPTVVNAFDDLCDLCGCSSRPLRSKSFLHLRCCPSQRSLRLRVVLCGDSLLHNCNPTTFTGNSKLKTLRTVILSEVRCSRTQSKDPRAADGIAAIQAISTTASVFLRALCGSSLWLKAFSIPSESQIL